ncbi:MAG: hypothetical protein M1269_06230 [Chloroflexi bacterium]|nr:hypothetical protein [Chloroflexota bacterium]
MNKRIIIALVVLCLFLIGAGVVIIFLRNGAAPLSFEQINAEIQKSMEMESRGEYKQAAGLLKNLLRKKLKTHDRLQVLVRTSQAVRYNEQYKSGKTGLDKINAPGNEYLLQAQKTFWDNLRDLGEQDADAAMFIGEETIDRADAFGATKFFEYVIKKNRHDRLNVLAYIFLARCCYMQNDLKKCRYNLSMAEKMKESVRFPEGEEGSRPYFLIAETYGDIFAQLKNKGKDEADFQASEKFYRKAIKASPMGYFGVMSRLYLSRLYFLKGRLNEGLLELKEMCGNLKKRVENSKATAAEIENDNFLFGMVLFTFDYFLFPALHPAGKPGDSFENFRVFYDGTGSNPGADPDRMKKVNPLLEKLSKQIRNRKFEDALRTIDLIIETAKR